MGLYERISKDNFGGQIGLGYNLLHGFAVEADASRANFSISGLTAEQRLTGYSLDVIKKFFPDSVVRPHVLAGGGEMDDTLTKSPRTFHTVLAEAGVGLLTGLGDQTGSTRVQLRTEAKYRLEFASAGNYGPKDPSDLIFGVDSDGDGVPDSIDQCPNTPKGTPVDSVGCPIKDEIKLQGVNFATGSAELIPTSDFVLSYAVSSLKKNPSLVIEVDGHTDSGGSAQKNLALSQARAESVMLYLKQHGVTNSMTASSFSR
jgi:outer membrane protein OmpA-like peptidoglycan-associated protein